MAQRYNVSQNQETFYNLSQYAFTQEQVKLRLESYWNEAYKQILECNNILENAEKKITILLEKNGDFEEKPFDTNNE